MIGGSDPLVAAVIARLKERLPAALAAQNARYGDDVPLPMPDDDVIRDYVAPDESSYPALYVLAGDAWTGEQTGAWLTATHEVTVVLLHQADTTQHLAYAIRRYEAAVRDALLARQAPAPAHGLMWRRSRRSPIFAPEEDQPTAWMTWVEVVFELTVYEEDLTP